MAERGRYLGLKEWAEGDDGLVAAVIPNLDELIELLGQGSADQQIELEPFVLPASIQPESEVTGRVEKTGNRILFYSEVRPTDNTTSLPGIEAFQFDSPKKVARWGRDGSLVIPTESGLTSVTVSPTRYSIATGADTTSKTPFTNHLSTHVRALQGVVRFLSSDKAKPVEFVFQPSRANVSPLR